MLVNVVALGLIKEHEIIHSKAPADAIGWDIVLVGKATDRSGFGGASFSSLTLDDADAESNKGAVQVPDPFLKNVIMRASYRVFAELRRAGIAAGFKDLGAGGFVGCSAELCAAGGCGAEVELDRDPARAGRPPAGGDRDRRDAGAAVLDRAAGVHAAAARDLQRRVRAAADRARRGARRSSARSSRASRYVARHRGEIVMDVDLGFLTGGVRYNRPYTVASPDAARRPATTAFAGIAARARRAAGAPRRLFARARSSSATTASCAGRPRSRSAMPMPA